MTTPWLAGPEPAPLSGSSSLLPAATTPKPKWPQTSGSCLSIPFLSWTVLTPHHLVMLRRCVFQFVQFHLSLRGHADQGSLVHGSQSRGLLTLFLGVCVVNLWVTVSFSPWKALFTVF